MKDTKRWISLLMLGAFGLGLLVLLLLRFNFNVQVEPVTPEPSLPATGSPTPSNNSPTVARSPSATPVQPSPAASAPPQPDALANGKTRTGTLRVGNQTNHPLRVVLLAQQGDGSSPQPAKPQPNGQSLYGEPVHWDFAPEEGSERGLILSLPNSSLRLREGDILMAFVQDGSQRYWGPYVVGKTPLPAWNANDKEWLVLLKP